MLSAFARKKNHLQQNARMAYVAYDALLSPGELRELLEAAVVPYARGKPVSLLDIASGACANAFVEHATPRGAGRVDIALTPAWARSAVRLRAFGKIASLVDVVTQERTNLRVGWHLMVVAPGACAQGWHADAPGKRFYRTLLVPLTCDHPTAGTEFVTGMATTRLVNPYGGALLFDGSVVHRGCGNPPGQSRRLFLYAAIFSGVDPNT
jgi:hypothetical protein